MLIDITPLRKYPDYRLLFIGQLVSTFGSMITYVALPFQVYHLTQSTFSVGIIGLVELIPLLLTAFLGGIFADTLDRRKLLIYSEIGIAFVVLMLTINASLTNPNIWVIYVLAAIMSALNGFHRPALDALTPRMVAKEDIHSLSALSSFKSVMGTIAGPTIAGLCVAMFGWVFTYLIDFFTFFVSIIALSKIKHFPKNLNSDNKMSVHNVIEGIRYAGSRQELIGSYVIDFVAMVFSMPTALFPALAAIYHKPEWVGVFYAAPSIGALIANLLSGWTKKIHRHGLAIAIAAATWGIAILAFGFASNLWLALGMLVIAGLADMYSVIFRFTLWNQTIPDNLRGRLAGIEMISYSSGPLLGNVQAGMVSAAIGVQNAIMLGGVLCIAGVGLCASFLPKFIRYVAEEKK